MIVAERLGKRLPIAVDCEQSLSSFRFSQESAREMREARAPLPSRDFRHARGY